MPFRKGYRLSDGELRLVELIGLDRTVAFMSAFDGYDYVYVPQEGYLGLIAEKMGEEVSVLLSRELGETRIVVTNLQRKLEKQDRALDIADAVQSRKMSAREIAKKFECSVRWVRMKAADLGVDLPSKTPRIAASNARTDRKADGHRQNLRKRDNDGRIRDFIKEARRTRKSFRSVDLMVQFGRTERDINSIKDSFLYLDGRGLSDV